MRRSLAVPLLAASLLLSLLALSLACPPPKLNPNPKYKAEKAVRVFSQDQTNLNVEKGQEFAVRLNSNPTTGYTWLLKDDAVPDGLEFLGCRYKRNPVDEAMVGVGGVETWGFRAKSGLSSVQLDLQKVRPWVQPRPAHMDASFKVSISGADEE